MKKKIIKKESLKFKEFFKYSEFIRKYGKQNNKASQVVTCVSTMVSNWFIGKKTFKNHYEIMSVASWLYIHTNKKVREILDSVDSLNYDIMLLELSDELMNDETLSIYSCMKIGSGCNVHLKASELPKGKIICSLSRHFTCVIDGVINDTYDCSRAENRCVYGYYYKG